MRELYSIIKPSVCCSRSIMIKAAIQYKSVLYLTDILLLLFFFFTAKHREKKYNTILYFYIKNVIHVLFIKIKYH